MFCILYNKDLYEDLNHGYIFALRHNLWRWRSDTHTVNHFLISELFQLMRPATFLVNDEQILDLCYMYAMR
jgi:hypothetical protein